MVCRNFILPETCKPCLFLSTFQFAKLILPYHSKIQSLEQKLQKLETEKQKAAQRKDEEQKEKLEKQIKEIEKQIQQLRKQENEKAQKTESSDIQKAQESFSKAIDAGKYIDVYA